MVTLRNSGLINLPSGRTLTDYRHCVPSTVCFSSKIDQQLITLASKTKPSLSLAHDVALLIDEMYIKKRTGFDKFTGSLTGFR